MSLQAEEVKDNHEIIKNIDCYFYDAYPMDDSLCGDTINITANTGC
jgi:hypothetical protein